MKKTSSPQPIIVYIGGYGHSGSTILGLLLGMQSNYFAPGEVCRIFADWATSANCSCGEFVADCQFWQGVRARFDAKFPGFNPAQFHELTLRIEHLFNLRTFLELSSDDANFYVEVWRTLLNIIALESDTRVLVDTSKTAYKTSQRPLMLTHMGFSVRLIHLVRDPRAVAWSMLRVDKQQSVFKTIISWYIANLYVPFRMRSIPNIKIFRLNFEDFTRAPAPALQRLGDALDLDLNESIDIVKAKQPISGEHMAAGNQLRTRPPRPIEHLPPSWSQNLSQAQRRAAFLSYPLMKYYNLL